MTVDAIKRRVWEDPEKRVNGPVPRGKPRTWVIHYPGGGNPPTGAGVPAYLRQIQSSYLSSRGYSIGYNWGVSQDGARWEIRGDDFNNAANAGRKVAGNFNDVSQSIFVMVSNQDAATPTAVDSINSIIATQPDWDVIVHGDVDYTQCAGAGLTAQVREGIIGHQAPTPPDIGDEVMIGFCKHKDHPAVYAQWSNGTKTWVPDPGVYTVMKAIHGVPDRNGFMMNADDNWIAAAGVIVGPVPNGVDGFGRPK